MQGTKTKIYAFLVSVLFAGTLACAPPYSPGGNGQDPSDSGSTSVPELNDEVIRDRISDARVFEIMPEIGNGDPITWRFGGDEPKEIAVIDKQVNGTRATVVLDIKTRSSMRSNILRYLAGQIKTEWELRTGLVLRRWEIVRTENISMKYKDVPKPSPSQTPPSDSGH